MQRTGPPRDNSSPHPAPVSVIVPLFNETATVTRLLEALNSQELPPAEVVCVDAGSTDDTAQCVDNFRGRVPVRLLRRGRMNPGEARNAGVASAAHSWIAFADGGTEPEPSWLCALMKAAGGGADVVFGSYEPLCDTFFRRCAALAYVPPRGPEGIRGPFIASTALRRKAHEAVGGFPAQRASEDLVFIEKVRASELRIAYAPEAVVVWQTAPGPASTFRRFALYSRVNLDVGRGRYWHRGLGRQTILVAAAILATVLIGGGAWGLALVPGWYLARVAKQARAKRMEMPFRVWHPHLLVGAAALLVVVDLATWVGALRWLTKAGGNSR